MPAMSLPVFGDITAEPEAGHIGARLSGVDLSQPLAENVVEQVAAALAAYKVLFARGQHLTHATQVALGERFGPLTRRRGTLHGPHPAGFPQILAIDPDADDARYGRDFEERYRAKWRDYTSGWHSDLSPHPNPPSISILRAHQVPSFGGDTQWTNTAAAYRGLAEPLQHLVDGLWAEHTFFAGCHLDPADPQDARVLELNTANLQAAHHPVVRVHPATGERALFVNPASTSHILGMPPADSTALLELLYAHILRPEYTVRWHWQDGDVVLWDNRTTAHLAAVDTAHIDQPRRMYRVAVLGEYPTGADGQTSQLVAGRELAPFDPSQTEPTSQ